MMSDPGTEASLEAVLEKARQMRVEEGGDGSGAPPPPPPRLHPGGGGSMSNPMEARVTRLETHMEYVRSDLHKIDAKLDTLITRTADLPTKSDLWTWRLQWAAIAIGAIALIVGGIIGGLGWIKPESAPPSPIVVQMPAPSPTAPVAADAPRRP